MSLLKIKHLTGNRRNEEAIMFWPFQKVYGVINCRQQEAEGGGAWEDWLQRSLQTWGGSREPRRAARVRRGHLCLPDTTPCVRSWQWKTQSRFCVTLVELPNYSGPVSKELSKSLHELK